jgi:anti-sigma regulatory factor (Ser/Thr protein kinase)
MPDFGSELTLPSDTRAVDVARAYAAEITRLAGLTAADAGAFTDAIRTACADIVQNALTPGEVGALTLAATITPTTLTVAVRERGAPFDPARVDRTADSPVRGCDWDRIRHAVDEAHWASRGNTGMELILTKRRPLADVTAHVPAEALTRFREDEPLAPEQTYEIRRLRPEDAIGVSRCVYRAYGYTYGNADLYYPERIVHLNETGQLVSVVAVDEAGDVVGHLALERPVRGPVAESGQAVVAPAHRGRHLLNRLREFAEAEARRLSLDGLVGFPVTTHVFSQRMEESIGATACGVALGHAPASLTFKDIVSEPLRQRVTTLFYFKYLVSPPRTRVHLPARHRGMLERVYADLGVPFEHGVPAGPSGRGRLTATLNRAWGFGTIRVDVVGEDSAAEIRRARLDLAETAGVQVVYLLLPLAQAGTPALCDAAEAERFFWSGVRPREAADGDMLCLQHVGVDLDFALIQVASPGGRALLDYVAAERQRVTSRPE